MVIRRRIDLGGGGVGTSAAPAAAVSAGVEIHLAALAKLLKEKKCYPLSSPGLGMIPINSAFLRFATLCGDGSEILREQVKQDGKSRTIVSVAPGAELPKLVDTITAEDVTRVAKEHFGTHAIGIQLPAT